MGTQFSNFEAESKLLISLLKSSFYWRMILRHAIISHKLWTKRAGSRFLTLDFGPYRIDSSEKDGIGTVRSTVCSVSKDKKKKKKPQVVQLLSSNLSSLEEEEKI